VLRSFPATASSSWLKLLQNKRRATVPEVSNRWRESRWSWKDENRIDRLTHDVILFLNAIIFT